MRKLLIGCVLLAVAPLLWQPLRGQSPSVRVRHNPKQQPKLTTDKATVDQRGTQYAPLLVDGIGRAKSTQPAFEDKADKDHAAAVNGWTLFFTGIAASCTALLVIVGWRGVRAATLTLIAIKRQADLQERAIRPWVGATLVTHGTIISMSDKPQVGARITLHNTGPSVALKGFMLPFLISSRHDVLPNAIKDVWQKMAEVLNGQAEWNTGFVLHPGRMHYQNANMGPFTEISMDEINNGTCYILVCIEYRDQFDRRHRTQDCFRLVPELSPPFNVTFEVVPAYQIAE